MRIISGIFKNRFIKAPKGLGTRPTLAAMRESVFNSLQTRVQEASFLDLFAGSGAMGLEAISRGAASAVFVDQSPQAMACLKTTIRDFSCERQTQVVKTDVLSFLAREPYKPFTIIYADPPYDSFVEKNGLSARLSSHILSLVDTYQWVEKGGCVFIEEKNGVPVLDEGLLHLKKVDERRFSSSMLHRFMA